MATCFALSDRLEQELIDALYNDYVRDGDRPNREELRVRLESLIGQLDECSIYEDEIIRATGSSQPYTCNAYPANLVEQTAHQAGVALLRFALHAIKENDGGELTPMRWFHQETGEPLREDEVIGQIDGETGKPVRPNFVLKPMRVDRDEVDRLILAIRLERELVRSSAQVETVPIELSYLDLVVNTEQRTVSRERSEIASISLTAREWAAFLLLYKARGDEVSLGAFKPPAYRGSIKGAALRNVLNGLGTKHHPREVEVDDLTLKDCRKTWHKRQGNLRLLLQTSHV